MLPLGLIFRHQTGFAILCGDASALTGSGHYYMAQHPGLRCSRNVILSVLFRGERWSHETLHFAFRGFEVRLIIPQFNMYYRRFAWVVRFCVQFSSIASWQIEVLLAILYLRRLSHFRIFS